MMSSSANAMMDETAGALGGLAALLGVDWLLNLIKINCFECNFINFLFHI